jgi:hypothetical protein
MCRYMEPAWDQIRNWIAPSPDIAARLAARW